MPAVILGVILAIVDVYAWLFGGSSVVSPRPVAITLGLPIAVSVGALKRPASERIPILVFAGLLTLALNRTRTGPEALTHLSIQGGAAYLMWWAYQTPELSKAGCHRLALSTVATIAGLLLVWAWQQV